MTNLIQRLTEAIFRQEGMDPEYPNPGNLRLAPWFQSTSLVYVVEHGFWKPSDRVIGEAGALHVVALAVARGRTLRQLISAWAPVADGNDTETYIKNVKQWAGVPNEDIPLWFYLEEKNYVQGADDTRTA